jgi:hypothetical protein
MHPDILRSLAAERVKDMREHSTAMRRSRMARRSQPAARAAAVAVLLGAVSRPARDTTGQTAGRQASCPPAA